MKPTHGLVPYTGIMPIEVTVDHAGPMTQNVEDNALMLEVIAGADGLDPRQIDIKTQRYTKFLNGKQGIEGLKIGIVKEGFQQEGYEKDVNLKVRNALEHLKELGATVEEVSIPMVFQNAVAIPLPWFGPNFIFIWSCALAASSVSIKPIFPSFGPK